jgi:hypothetical protein
MRAMSQDHGLSKNLLALATFAAHQPSPTLEGNGKRKPCFPYSLIDPSPAGAPHTHGCSIELVEI